MKGTVEPNNHEERSNADLVKVADVLVRGLEASGGILSRLIGGGWISGRGAALREVSDEDLIEVVDILLVGFEAAKAQDTSPRVLRRYQRQLEVLESELRRRKRSGNGE